MTSLAVLVSNFGDAGVVTPLCIAIAITLLLCGSRRVAVAWTVITAGVWGTMLTLKLTGYAFESLAAHLPLPQLGLASPSGHAAAAAAAYGGMIGLLFGSVRRAALAGLAVAIPIGVSRVVLGDHTPAEVIVGGMVGTVGAGAFAAWARGRVAGRTQLAVVGVTAVVMLVFYGSHVTWEPAIRETSAYAVRELLAKSL